MTVNNVNIGGNSAGGQRMDGAGFDNAMNKARGQAGGNGHGTPAPGKGGSGGGKVKGNSGGGKANGGSGGKAKGGSGGGKSKGHNPALFPE